MANVLGTLFADIANAIREKNGETGTIKPAEFPEKIAGITVSSEGSGTSVVCKTGTFNITSDQLDSNGAYTVNHAMGVVPDFVVVLKQDISSLATGSIIAVTGASTALISATSPKQTSIMNANNVQSVGNVAIDREFDSISQSHGFICEANETSFKVGGNTTVAGYKYYWIAIGGIT